MTSSPSPTLREQLVTDIQLSMKMGKKERLPVLRGLLTEIVVEEKKGTQTGKPLGDEGVLTVLLREKKKYEEAAGFAEQAKRTDLWKNNCANISILHEYLPAPLTDDEVDQLITTLIHHLNVTSVKNMGAIMKELSPHIKGRYDGKTASERVKELLLQTKKEDNIVC